MLKRFHWILKSLEGPTKISICRYLTLEVYSTLIEYEKEKAKPVNYRIQIVDYDDLENHRQEWVSERLVHLFTDPSLTRAIGFFNIYHQCWPLIEKGKTLMHYGNTTFAYDNRFKEYMNVERAVLENIFDYLFDVGVGKFLSKK